MPARQSQTKYFQTNQKQFLLRLQNKLLKGSVNKTQQGLRGGDAALLVSLKNHGSGSMYILRASHSPPSACMAMLPEDALQPETSFIKVPLT